MQKSLILLALLSGCFLANSAANRTWHQKYNWKAEDYFKDPQVIALCKAIESEDLQEIDRLVKAGANVKAQGKGNMTPLMWAFPDKKLGRFRRLLEHGADPNVIFTSDFGTKGMQALKGKSVTHLASRLNSFEHFKTVFTHGGDPNLVQTSIIQTGESPLYITIQYGFSDKKQRLQLLIDKNADLDRLFSSGNTPTMLAASGGQFDIALMLLKAGANPRVHRSNEAFKLIHFLAIEEKRGRALEPSRKRDFETLVAWLESRGESLDEARSDIKRWASWSRSRKGNGKSEYRRKMDAEIAALKAKEAQEKQQKDPQAKRGKAEEQPEKLEQFE